MEEPLNQRSLPSNQLKLGEVLDITHQQPPQNDTILQAKKQRRPGTMKGTVLGMSSDFNAPLNDFKEYMQ